MWQFSEPMAKTLGVRKNSLKRVHAFQNELKFGRVALVFEEKGKPEYPGKTSSSKRENQQQTQTTYGVDTTI